MYVITEWFERYEINKSGRDPKPGEELRATPLSYVPWKVHGHSQSPGYRKLNRNCKLRTMEVLGIFGKLLELAGNCPRELRKGAIRNENGEPATAADLAFILSFPEKRIQRALDDLVKVGWIQKIESQSASQRDSRNTSERNETRNRTQLDRRKQRGSAQPQGIENAGKP